MKLVHALPTVCYLCDLNACYEEFPICCDCVCDFYRLLDERCVVCGETTAKCKCSNNKNIRYLFYFDTYESRLLLYAFKCMAETNCIRFWAELVVKGCIKNNEKFDAVTYVPRSWGNRQVYGYDQSKKLATEVGRILDIPVVNLLKRKGFRRQKLLSAKQRYKNARKLFVLRSAPEVKYKNLLLLDDIFTTGATLVACRDVLREHAAESVVCAVLAKTNVLLN